VPTFLTVQRGGGVANASAVIGAGSYLFHVREDDPRPFDGFRWWRLHVRRVGPNGDATTALDFDYYDEASGVARVVAALLRERDPLPLEAALARLADLLSGEPVIGELIAALQAEGRADPCRT